MDTQNNTKSDDEIRHLLQNTTVPEPVGGHETARERVMGKVRHTFPVGSPTPNVTSAPKRISHLGGSLSAGAVIAGLALAIFFAWPQQSTKAEELPSEAQMQQFYDQHETNHIAHLQEIAIEAAEQAGAGK
jgi:hypothetical protein